MICQAPDVLRRKVSDMRCSIAILCRCSLGNKRCGYANVDDAAFLAPHAT
jgi:hypothetical protein